MAHSVATNDHDGTRSAPPVMNVLIPTTRSDLIGGKESYVRDVALGLTRRGYRVAVLSDIAAPDIRSMQSEGILVCTDAGNLPFAPDIIHGQAIIDTLRALALNPGTPALYQVHGAGPLGNPLHHPRIYRYAGMTETTVVRVAIELGLPRSATVVIRNSIDLGRFAVVREPATRPKRALFYSSYHRPGSQTYEAVRAAVLASGMEFDSIGRPFGTRIEGPQNVLPAYDLVFAAGISAIEALGCGCAVVVIGMTSCGALVDPDNLDRHIASNFALAFNAPPADEHRVRAEIERYSASACAEVTRRVRIACDGERMLDVLVGTYEDIVAEHRRTPPSAEDERAAVAALLRRLAPLVGAIDAHGDLAMPLTSARGTRICYEALTHLPVARDRE